MTTKKSAAATLYPTRHDGPKKKQKDARLTHALGGGSKVPQQQQAPVKTTVRPHNAAAVKR